MTNAIIHMTAALHLINAQGPAAYPTLEHAAEFACDSSVRAGVGAALSFALGLDYCAITELAAAMPMSQAARAVRRLRIEVTDSPQIWDLERN
jgi:hypothetical protein